MNRSTVIVIGAGIIGLSCALRIRQAGLEVTVLEQGAVGKEASWAGGGILSPLHPWRYQPALLALAREGMLRYAAFSQEIFQASTIDPEYLASGLLVLDSPTSPIPEDSVSWGRSWGWNWRNVTAAELAEIAPQLQGERAIYCPEVAQVRNPRLLAGLRAYLQALGVAIQEEVRIDTIIPRAGHVILQVGNKVWEAKKVVVSAGAWTADLLASLGRKLPIAPVRGQIILLAGEPGTLPVPVLQGNHYLVQRRDGQVLVGSTTELVAFDKGTTTAAREELLSFSHRVFPPSRSYPILRQWSGLRPGSPENIPMIGYLPGMENILVAAGHFRYGLTTAPITAEIITDLVLGRQAKMDISPYSLPK